MADILQFRRSNTAGINVTTPAAGEFLVNTDDYRVLVGDGATVGGRRIDRLITETKTTTYTVATTDAGKHFNTIGAGGSVTFDLPAAAASRGPFGFLVGAAQNLIIDPNGTDLIRAANVLVSTNGGNFSSNVQYSFIQIEAHAAGYWIVTQMLGPWTAV